MKNKEIMENTTNRGEFNRAYKIYLESVGKIHCSRCKFHENENFTNNHYGGYLNNSYIKNKLSWRINDIKYPNWKLVSKNRKQWQKKPIKIIENNYFNRKYFDIEF